MAAKSQTLELIIKLRDAVSQELRQVNSNFIVGRKALEAFNKESRIGQTVTNALRSQVVQLAGAFVGFKALATLTNKLKEADQAVFNLQGSLSAAGREFGDVGSLQEWENMLKRLSKELAVYSDTALQNAAARTVDMTKSLGLNREQMEQVIHRAADLGAGKMALSETVERVTEALRGEARSAEKLGLTLNEEYVRSQYEANNATGQAWEKLTDLEKAQERYNQFLKQTENVLGRSGQSLNTFGGALAMINKEIDNAISNNTDVQAAMQEIAKVLRENAGSIGQLISLLVTGIAKISAFVVEHKTLIAALLGTAAGISVINKLVGIFQGLHAAAVVLKGAGLVTWAKDLTGALNGVAGSSTAAGAALQAGLAAAAAWGVVKIAELIKVIYEWRQAVGENKSTAAGYIKEAEQYAHAKDIEIKSTAEFLKMSKEEQFAYRENLKAANLYWGRTEAALILQEKDATEAQGRSAEIQKNSKEITEVWFKLQDMQPQKRSDNTKEQPVKALNEEERKKIAEDRKELERQLADELAEIDKDKWAKLRYQALQHYKAEAAMAHEQEDLLERAETFYKSELAKIQREENQERLEKLRAIDTAAIESEINRTQALTASSLAELDRIYKNGGIAIEQYFARRRELLEKQYQAEVAAQQKLMTLLAPDDPKRRGMEDELFAKEQAHKRELIDLTEEQVRAEEALRQKKAEAAQILDDAKMRVKELAAVSLRDQYAVEMEQLRQRQEAERQALSDRLDWQGDYFNSKQRLEELDDIHVQERTQKSLEQERRFREAQLNMTADLCGNTADLFENLYELTGKKHKEFFYLSRAAALAQAVINVAQGVTKAIAEGGTWGIVQGLIVAATGGIQIAKIAAQHLAGGGRILGYSPHDRADNIPIQATAGEFMQPVPTVRYYGTQVMEALRRRLIPREIFAGLKLPALTSRASLTLAEGGPVPAPKPGREENTKDKLKLDIVNINSDRMIDRYFASNSGNRMFINLVGQNAYEIKRMIAEV